jgi:hypothetical protein
MPIFGATTAATGGGTDGNFFAYRLPYLKDYSGTSGIIYTPVVEKPRYLSRIAPAALTSMPQAGDYDDFTTDFWAIQIARYRHRHSLGVTTLSFRRDDSFALVHFRRETYFEEFIRDGVIPTADKLYSVSLVDWALGFTVADTRNLTNVYPAAPPATSTAYSVNASEITEDPTGSTTPALALSPSNTFTFTGTSTIFTSGVEYYVPRDPVTGAAAAQITALDVGIDNVFLSSYRTHDTPPAPLSLPNALKNAVNQNPVFLSLSPFSYEGTELPDADTISLTGMAPTQLFPGFLGLTKRQRIEFGFSDLTGGALNPATGAVAGISLAPAPGTSIDFDGDQNTPAFTTDAKVRAFVRRPLVVDGTTGYPLPADPLAGLPIANAAPDQILFHSMKESPLATPTYGNAATPAPSLYTPTKDREERFLDEVYRYPQDWASTAGLPAPTLANLVGPGLPSGLGAIDLPVRPTLVGGLWDGYYLLGRNLTSLDAAGPPAMQQELQVAGLPERNPPYTDGVVSPFPSRGILLFPQDDYSSGYDPIGPNYSAVTSPLGLRAYIRAFNAGAANVGNTSIIIRVWGVQLTDFAFTAGPGPFGSGDLFIAIKVPGLTTFMNAGRVDGAGPSKQDPAIDGAGCKVIGPNTFDAVDPGSQITYSQVEINLGPLAPLFLNTSGDCPVLIGVVLQDTATARSNYNWRNVGPTAATASCRGIVGLDMVIP